MDDRKRDSLSAGQFCETWGQTNLDAYFRAHKSGLRAFAEAYHLSVESTRQSSRTVSRETAPEPHPDAITNTLHEFAQFYTWSSHEIGSVRTLMKMAAGETASSTLPDAQGGPSAEPQRCGEIGKKVAQELRRRCNTKLSLLHQSAWYEAANEVEKFADSVVKQRESERSLREQLSRVSEERK